jgi:CBS domain-containing protein
MNVGTVCTRLVVTCSPVISALDAATLMREYHVGDLVVAEDRGGTLYPVGMVTDRDLVIEVMAKELDPESVKTGDLMSRDLITLDESADLQSAIAVMRDARVRRVPVVSPTGGLVGIVTQDDVANGLALQLGDLSRIGALQAASEQRQRA